MALIYTQCLKCIGNRTPFVGQMFRLVLILLYREACLPACRKRESEGRQACFYILSPQGWEYLTVLTLCGHVAGPHEDNCVPFFNDTNFYLKKKKAETSTKLFPFGC